MDPPDAHGPRVAGDALSGWRLDATALDRHARAISQRRTPLDVRVRAVPAGGGDLGVTIAPAAARPAWEWRAFGASWRLYHDGLVSARLARRAASHVLLDEMQWSRFAPGSDVRQVNGLAGRRVRVATSTVALATVANAFTLDTDGLFQPLIGHAMEAWGWPDASVRPVGTATSPTQVLVPDQLIDIEAVSRGLSVPIGAKLDLGGVAPSFAAFRAATVLRELSHDIEALVVAGSQAVAVGSSARVNLVLPLAGVETELVLPAGHGLACSSSAAVPWTNADGVVAHSVIDPATGRPGHAGDAAAIAETVVHADVLAKVALLRPALVERSLDPCLAWVDGVEHVSPSWGLQIPAPE